VAQPAPILRARHGARLSAGLSPQDSIYPGVLFNRGPSRERAATAPRTCSAWWSSTRVGVGHSALVLLTQLYFAQGDPAATVQARSGLRLDLS